MSQFNNIPLEMREYRQWIVWRSEFVDGSTKPTKVPYTPRQGALKASVTKPATWGTFEEAINAPLTCNETVQSGVSIEQTGFSGIGFVFTKNDPYIGIDLDDTHDDLEAFEVQKSIVEKFKTYTEFSPSGNGLHLITKGELPHGRRRNSVEMYDNERYFTMTGNVYLDLPINDNQKLADILFEEMGGKANLDVAVHEKEQTLTDEEVYNTALAAANGEKFHKLFMGDFHSLYPSQSEADFALFDIIAFYSQNREQCYRLFRASVLGERDKAQRDDYLKYMFNKSMDRQLPPIDIEGLKVQFEQARANAIGALADSGTGQLPTTSAPNGAESITCAAPPVSHDRAANVNQFPPGLIGELAQFLLDAAPRPVPDIALAGAISFMAGICGRAYNVSGVGLNQYVLMLAPTGTGKDAISSGVSRLMSHVLKSVPAADVFKGPGELVSSAGLIKWLHNKPTAFSIVGEVGLLLQQMACSTASPHLKGLERFLLQVYSKSGHGNVFDPIAYSDKDKNTAPIASPSFTMIGESVPERFYEILDDNIIASGLLPRFMVFEYTGQRVYLNEGTEYIEPSFRLVQQVADLCATVLSVCSNGNVNNVGFTEEAADKFREFERWTTDQINATKSDNIAHLWNRAHLKAMKLAAIVAVGINPHNPIIDINCCMWATDVIEKQTNKLIVKFESGNVGQKSGAESRQLRDVVRIITSYFNEPFEVNKKYGGTEEMHRNGVITQAHISRRAMSLASFRNDRLGATAALTRTIKMLLEADELREIPKKQMQDSFGTGPRAFVAANPARFLPKADD